MKLTLPNRLLEREQGGDFRHSTVRSIYGDKAWVDDLDIVNELGGHSGCVNALRYASSRRWTSASLWRPCANIITSTVGPVQVVCWRRDLTISI